MVRLIGDDQRGRHVLQPEFQFQNGSINRGQQGYTYRIGEMFQFQNGSINSLAPRYRDRMLA